MKKIKIKQNREGEFGMEFKNIVAKTNFPLQPYCRPNIWTIKVNPFHILAQVIVFFKCLKFWSPLYWFSLSDDIEKPCNTIELLN